METGDGYYYTVRTCPNARSIVKGVRREGSSATATALTESRHPLGKIWAGLFGKWENGSWWSRRTR